MRLNGLIRAWKHSRPAVRISLAVYIACFVIATCTHVMDIVRGGFLPYRSQPLWANLYWTSLTFLDPLSILLMFVSIEAGLALYALVIASDVAINFRFALAAEGIGGILNIYQLGQLGCLVFYAATIGMVINSIRSAAHAPRSAQLH